MNRELLAKAFGDIDEDIVAQAYRPATEAASGSPERTVHMNRKRILTIAFAAALILALGISAYAIWGAPRSTGTHLMPKEGEYTSLSDLSKVEADVGYPVTVPERFSNGYVFTQLRVGGQAVFGENNEVLKEYYDVSAIYAREGSPDLRLVLDPLLEYEETNDAPMPTPSEQRTIDGVTVDLTLDHYKAVPEDYEKTADDLAREAEGHYYISFGSDEIREYEIAFAGFTLGDVVYTLMDMEASGSSLDALAGMAAEIIQAAQN